MRDTHPAWFFRARKQPEIPIITPSHKQITIRRCDKQGSNLSNLSDKLRIQSGKVRIENTSDKQGKDCDPPASFRVNGTDQSKTDRSRRIEERAENRCGVAADLATRARRRSGASTGGRLVSG